MSCYKAHISNSLDPYIGPHWATYSFYLVGPMQKKICLALAVLYSVESTFAFNIGFVWYQL